MAVVPGTALTPIREVILRIGEVRALAHKLDWDATVTITTPLIVIYDSAGTAVVASTAATVDPATAATAHTLSYLWSTAGRTAGDYTYLISYVQNSETRIIRGAVTLLPVTSKFDRWVEEIAGIIQTTPAAEAVQELSYRDYMRAAVNAVREYEKNHPRLAQKDVTLTAGVWEYALTTLDIAAAGGVAAFGWVNQLSQIIRAEYPLDDTQQSKSELAWGDVRIDERRAKWRLMANTPAASESARIDYTTSHTLDHTYDTTPELDFPFVAQWAAGNALLRLANRSVGTNAPGIAADVVNFRTKRQEYTAAAEVMQKQASDGWARLLNWGL